MKNIYTLILIAICVAGFSCKTTKVNDAVSIASDKNDAKAASGMINKEAADFLVDMADARMMDAREGELAIKNGTTDEIKNYGRLMVKDQVVLLAKIKKIALKKSITIPAEISADKQDGLNDLKSKNGKDFDSKFLKMISLDHERDVNAFTNASSIADKSVSNFASANLPLIQSHLDKVNLIKENR